MSVVQVATRYASAFLEEAQRQGILEGAYSDVRTMEAALSSNRDLQLMMKSPIVSSAIKMASLRQIFTGNVSRLTSDFLELLVRKRREAYLGYIIPAFYRAYNQLKNIEEIEIISAHELSASLEEKIVR